jgi:hypothetical protein
MHDHMNSLTIFKSESDRANHERGQTYKLDHMAKIIV